MLMEVNMRNGEVVAAICEQHDKEVIFAAAVQAISLLAAGMSQPKQIHMDYAMGLMQFILDKNGLELASIIANNKAKA